MDCHRVNPGRDGPSIKAWKNKIRESAGSMFGHRCDILCAWGQVHTETVIMTSVWGNDGKWDSIGLMSQRLSSTMETAWWSSPGSVFEIKTHWKKKKIVLTKNANFSFGDVELKRDLGSNESGRSKIGQRMVINYHVLSQVAFSHL